MELIEIQGDATLAGMASGRKIIVHVVNSMGGWGKGFVLAINKRYGKSPASLYRQWHKERNVDSLLPERNKFQLGGVQIIDIGPNLFLGNMLAQVGLGGKHKRSTSKRMQPNDDPNQGDFPLNYSALRTCLENLVTECNLREITSIHMPRIGCGLGGGNWEYVREIITEIVCKQGKIPVYVYYQ